MSAFATWSKKLADLLVAAEQAAQENELNQRLAVIRQLTDFVVNSTPNTPDILELDDLAQKARRDLMLDTIEQRVREITSRTGELVRLRKKFGALADGATASADSIGLVPVEDVVRSLTDTTLSLSALKRELPSHSPKKIRDRITQLLGDLRELRGDLEELGQG